MIEKLIAKSRVTEVDAVSIRMTGAYKNTTLNSDSHLAAMFAGLETLSGKLTSAINRSKAESDLETKDEVRDDKVRALNYLVTGFLYHPDDAVKSAAQKVEKVFGKYGVAITGESYATESSLVNSLLDDLAKPNLQEAVSQLPGCAEIITALQSAQDEFEAARIVYEQEKAQESTETNATNIKKEVVDLVNNKIVVYLRAMELVDMETYGPFARTIAEIIADNNETVKKRRKKEAPVTGLTE